MQKHVCNVNGGRHCVHGAVSNSPVTIVWNLETCSPSGHFLCNKFYIRWKRRAATICKDKNKYL